MRTQKKHATPTPVETIAAKARRVGIARSTLLAWQASGVNIHDERQLQARLAVKQLRATATATEPPDDGESYTAAKTRRARADADRAETLAKQLSGELTPKAEIEADGYAIGLAMRQALDRLAHELPAMLAGQTAAQCSKILKFHFRQSLEYLSHLSNVIKP